MFVRKLITIASILLGLNLAGANVSGQPLYQQLQFSSYEVPFYRFAEFTPQVALYMSYAQFQIANPDEWENLKGQNEAYEIDLVFTKYPRELHNWQTPYYELLENRLQTLVAIDSSFLLPKVRWNLVLQTQCKTEPEAKGYFHGFVIKYRPCNADEIAEVDNPQDFLDLIEGRKVMRDSTIMQVMDRHPEWDSMMVILDWTGSMYLFGAQLINWYRRILNSEPGRVRHFIFFNDGNEKSHRLKQVGKTGGVYHTLTNDLEEIVETMKTVMDKGNGGDGPENDVEAVLTGINNLSGFKELILIADNKSTIRDLKLAQRINRPVRIVLCDVKGRILQDYIRLAYTTGGSLHTSSRDYDYPMIKKYMEAKRPPQP